jgi:hypothetical protein
MLPMTTDKNKNDKNKKKEQCKAYTQAQGAYSSFYSGAQCKRNAWKDGYCKQHQPTP